MTHTELVKRILDLSKKPPFKDRITLIKNHTGRRGRVSFGFKGWSDLIGYDWQGLFVGIEVKVGRDKLSLEQIEFRDSLLSRGAHWFEIRTESEAIEALRKICQV